ncbi:hypothetical protein MPL3365_670004 [Mesorhizobium plurifarium]|uniref:Uncharacterized protein n=1 Tax=Mesorhizobium plurifarium TaxID=69974 RepID=A0A090GGL5_MESPL|nr:hypothetical protein MPL3365_670004 [Mesorhizobium plurifarium]
MGRHRTRHHPRFGDCHIEGQAEPSEADGTLQRCVAGILRTKNSSIKIPISIPAMMPASAPAQCGPANSGGQHRSENFGGIENSPSIV